MAVITKKELIDNVSVTANLKKEDAKAVVNWIFRTITESLGKGDSVKIQNFGVFEVLNKAARDGFNPHNGEKIKIPAHKAVGFRAARELKESVN